MASSRKVYWDSCAWIGLINEEPDKLDACRYVIDQARNGDVEIWTSAYTLAEVFKRKCEDVQKGIAEDKDIVFEDFLDQDYIVYAQVDADVGKLARRLLRRYSELKKPPDAVHLATAIIHNLDEFHTFDSENLLVLNGRISRLDRKILNICVPPDPPPPRPPPPPDLFTQVQDANTAPPAVKEPEKADEDSPSPQATAAVRGGGEGVGVPGGRSGIRDGAEADSGGGAGSEVPAEEAGATTEAEMIDEFNPDNLPFERGIRACYDGKDLSDNPFKDGTPEHHEWMTGWYTGEQRMKA